MGIGKNFGKILKNLFNKGKAQAQTDAGSMLSGLISPATSNKVAAKTGSGNLRKIFVNEVGQDTSSYVPVVVNGKVALKNLPGYSEGNNLSLRHITNKDLENLGVSDLSHRHGGTMFTNEKGARIPVVNGKKVFFGGLDNAKVLNLADKDTALAVSKGYKYGLEKSGAFKDNNAPQAQIDFQVKQIQNGITGSINRGDIIDKLTGGDMVIKGMPDVLTETAPEYVLTNDNMVKKANFQPGYKIYDKTTKNIPDKPKSVEGVADPKNIYPSGTKIKFDKGLNIKAVETPVSDLADEWAENTTKEVKQYLPAKPEVKYGLDENGTGTIDLRSLNKLKVSQTAPKVATPVSNPTQELITQLPAEFNEYVGGYDATEELEEEMMTWLKDKGVDLDDLTDGDYSKISSAVSDILEKNGLVSVGYQDGKNYRNLIVPKGSEGYSGDNAWRAIDNAISDIGDYDVSRSWNAGNVPSRYLKLFDDQVRVANHSNNYSHPYNVQYSNDDLVRGKITPTQVKNDILWEVRNAIDNGEIVQEAFDNRYGMPALDVLDDVRLPNGIIHFNKADGTLSVVGQNPLKITDDTTADDVQKYLLDNLKKIKY